MFFIGMVKLPYKQGLHCYHSKGQIENKRLHNLTGASCNSLLFWQISHFKTLHYRQPCYFCLQDTVNILFYLCFTLKIERDEIRKSLLIKMILLVLVTVKHLSTTATFFSWQTVHTLTLIKISLQPPPLHYGMLIINHSNHILILFH